MNTPIANEQLPKALQKVNWREHAAKEAWEKAYPIVQSKKNALKYMAYQNKPVEFCADVLGDSFPDDVIRVMESVRDYPITIARSANAVGKCIKFGEVVVDTNGLPRPVERFLYPGEPSCSVFSFIDNPDNESMGTGRDRATFSYNGRKECYEITTDSGKRIARTSEHPLFVGEIHKISNRNIRRTVRPLGWKKISEITDKDCVLVVKQFPEIDNPIPMDENEIKLLAYMIGDGYCGNTGSSSYLFTQEDGVPLDEFRDIVESYGCVLKKEKDMHYSIRHYPESLKANHLLTTHPVGNILRKHGIFGKRSEQKSIPVSIWQLPLEQLAIFINRLYVTDGWVYSGYARAKSNKKAGVGATEIGYCSISLDLVEDLQFLLLRFGISACIRKKKTSWTHRGIKKQSFAYSLDIHNSSDIILFQEKIGIFGRKDALLRDLANLAKSKTKDVLWRMRGLENTSYRWEHVKSVENIGEHETVSISVENSHTFLTKFVEHNSYCAARMAIYFLSVYPESQVYITAAPPMSNIRNILWAHLSSIARDHPALFTGFKIKLFHIERNTTSFIDCVTIPLSGTPEQREGKFSGKHSPQIMFIVDEGDAVPEEVYKGIEGCMSNDYFRMLIMFNPRAAMGKIYEMESKGLANVVELSAMNHPNVITGQSIIPGAVARETTVRRINDWTRALVSGEVPDDDSFLVPNFLEGCVAVAKDGTPYPPLQAGWRKVRDPEFWYVVLGKYPPLGTRQLIADEWIKAAVDRWKTYVSIRGEIPPEGTSPIMGVDISEYGGDYNVACLRYGDYVALPIIWGGMDVVETADKAYGIYLKNKVYLAMIDACGIGTSVAPNMARKARDNTQDLRAVPVKVTEKPSPVITSDLGEFYQLRDQLWWAVREWLRNSYNAMLPDDQLLIEELRTITYENKSGKIKVMSKDHIREKLKRSSDRADALCLTFNPVARATVVPLE